MYIPVDSQAVVDAGIVKPQHARCHRGIYRLQYACRPIYSTGNGNVVEQGDVLGHNQFKHHRRVETTGFTSQ